MDVSQVNPNLIVAGSYDHTVRLYDTRTASGSVMCMRHDQAVESVILMPGDAMLVTASGN